MAPPAPRAGQSSGGSLLHPWPRWLWVWSWLASGALYASGAKDDPIVMHKKIRHRQHGHRRSPKAARQTPAEKRHVKGMELLQELAQDAPLASEAAEDRQPHRRKRSGSQQERLQLLQALVQQRQHHGQHRSQHRVVALQQGQSRRGLLMSAVKAAQDPEVSLDAGVAQAGTEREEVLLEEAQGEADQALHNNEQERDMLQTQMLSSSQSMFVLKRLAMTVQRMKVQVEALEQHEKICRKRVADFKSGQYERAEDAKLANSPQVVD